jgi:cell division septation protein DedD
MTQTDGEKELVLGNKQLISLFFVVVALCGVFFAMGYMIGRNTSKPATANLESNAQVAAAAPAAVPNGESPAPQSQDAEPPRDTAPEATQPASGIPSATAANTPSGTPANPPADSKPAPPTQTQAAHDTPAAVPEAGATYLQVTALRRADADNLVKTLREQNFPVLLAESSKPDLFRVLVGPYHQTAEVADAKARLKALGFANAFVQK